MKKTVIAAIVAIFLIAFVPLFVLKDAEFGGSDDAGSVVVEEVDSSYEPWLRLFLNSFLAESFRARWKVSFSVSRQVSESELSPL